MGDGRDGNDYPYSRRAPGIDPTPVETAQAKYSRKRTERERKALMVAAQVERERKESMIVAALASRPGISDRAIARETGLPQTSVRRLHADLDRRLSRQHDSEARSEILNACNARLAVWMPKALAGDVDADRRVQAICDLKARITGAYAVQQVEVSGRVEHVEIDAFVAAIELLNSQASTLEQAIPVMPEPVALPAAP